MASDSEEDYEFFGWRGETLAHDADYHQHNANARQPAVDAQTEAERILQVLQTMKNCGFGSLGKFHDAFFESPDERIKRRVGKFINSGGIREIVRHIRCHPKLSSLRRSALARATVDELRSEIGEDLEHIYSQILDLEVDSLAQIQELRMDRKQLITVEDCKQFKFSRLMDIFSEKAPLLTGMVRKLCGCSNVTPTGSDDMPDEGNDDETEEEPEMMETLGNHDSDQWDDLYEPIAYTMPEASQSRKRKRKRAYKNTTVIATTVLAQILYGHNRRINRLQVISHAMAC
jgi:hypothetical protein